MHNQFSHEDYKQKDLDFLDVEFTLTLMWQFVALRQSHNKSVSENAFNLLKLINSSSNTTISLRKLPFLCSYATFYIHNTNKFHFMTENNKNNKNNNLRDLSAIRISLSNSSADFIPSKSN
jgi:hypothetical protein